MDNTVTELARLPRNGLSGDACLLSVCLIPSYTSSPAYLHRVELYRILMSSISHSSMIFALALPPRIRMSAIISERSCFSTAVKKLENGTQRIQPSRGNGKLGKMAARYTIRDNIRARNVSYGSIKE